MTENEKIELFDKWYDENYDEWAEGEEGIALREELEQAFKSGIATLEKENAELKERVKIFEQIKQEHTDYTIKVEEERTLVKDQLTKAKELLKQWLQTSKASGCDNINIVTDTEQFLSEVEKWRFI